jgi:hypothetical protein
MHGFLKSWVPSTQESIFTKKLGQKNEAAILRMGALRHFFEIFLL